MSPGFLWAFRYLSMFNTLDIYWGCPGMTIQGKLWMHNRHLPQRQNGNLQGQTRKFINKPGNGSTAPGNPLWKLLADTDAVIENPVPNCITQEHFGGGTGSLQELLW